LDSSTSGARAVPEVEQVVVDSRNELVVGARKAGYVEKLGNSASGDKHVVTRTGVVLNTKPEPHSSEGGGGGTEGSLLSRRKRDSGLGEIANSRLSRQSRDRRSEESSDGSDDIGDGDHFLAYSNERG